MKERPVVMSAPMVLALIGGKKTQMRMEVKPQPTCYSHHEWPNQPDFRASFNEDGSICCGICMGKDQRLTRKDATGIRRPYGQVGGRLWVRETFFPDPPCDGMWADTEFHGCKYSRLTMIPKKYRNAEHVLYRASWDGVDLCWRPSIHMPR